MNAPTKPERSYLLLIAAIASGSFLMISAFGSTPLTIDEHVSYWIADWQSPGTLLERSLNYAATPPLSSLIQRPFLMVGGNSVQAFRASSVTCYLLAIVVVWYAAIEMFRSKAIAGSAALLLAWNPEVTDYVRLARPYGLSLLLASVPIWLTIRLRDKESLVGPVAWVLVARALAWTHYVNVPLIVLLWGSLVFSRIGSLRLILTGGAFALTCVPLLPSVIRLNEWSPFLNYHTQPPSFTDVIGPLWWIGLPMGVAAGLLIDRLSHPKQTSRQSVYDLRFIIAVSVLPLILLLCLSQSDMTSLADPRYRIVYVPGAVLAIAGILHACANCRGAVIGCGVVVFATSLTASPRPWDARFFSSPNPSDWKILAETLQREGQSGEPVIVQSGLVESRLVPALYGDRLFMDYVSCRLGRCHMKRAYERYALPAVWIAGTEMDEFYSKLIREHLDRGNAIWLAGATDTDLNRDSIDRFSTLARELGYVRSTRLQQSGCSLFRYEIAFDASIGGATVEAKD
jgi:hypothetical protein